MYISRTSCAIYFLLCYLPLLLAFYDSICFPMLAILNLKRSMRWCPASMKMGNVYICIRLHAKHRL
jgi:hypothetical protein